MAAKKIPLTEWAARYYAPAPTAWVLRRWARQGEITPQPERVGRDWYVLETACRGSAAESADIEPHTLSLVQRIRQARSA